MALKTSQRSHISGKNDLLFVTRGLIFFKKKIFMALNWHFTINVHMRDILHSKLSRRKRKITSDRENKNERKSHRIEGKKRVYFKMNFKHFFPSNNSIQIINLHKKDSVSVARRIALENILCGSFEWEILSY